MRRGLVALCCAGALLLPSAAMGGDEAALQSGEGPVALVARQGSELWPAASESYLAWAKSTPRRPNRFRAMVKPAGEPAFQVSEESKDGFPGGIDGNRLVFTEVGRSSNIRLYDLETHVRLPLPDQVNTKSEEWGATISEQWLLFGRVEPAPGRDTYVEKIFLFDLANGTGRELDASSTRSLEPGQVNGDWALWHSCSAKNCSTFRYRISDRTKERITLAQPTFAGSISADGTAYFAASRPACGKEVAFYEYPVDGSAKMLFNLPDGVDIYSSFAYEEGGATKIVFARITCSNVRGDVYGFDVSGAGPPPDVGPEIATGVGTVTYQIGIDHAGRLDDSTLKPPLRELWTTELGEGISYPLVAEGKTFVTVRHDENYPTSIYALDASTGTISWFRELSDEPWANAAYDDGKVFVLTHDGTMQAFDADDGTELWSTDLPDQRSFSSEPTAAGGMVYTTGAGSGATFYAVRQDTGAVVWTKPVASGHHSSPALSASTVFVASEGPQVYALDRTSGAERWHYAGCCSGSGRTPVFHDGYLYNRSGRNQILDASSGEVVGSFDAQFTPAFSGPRGFFFNGSRLVAREVPAGSVEWSFPGDGSLSSPAVVANGYVYIGSTQGHVYALDRENGAVAWRGTVGASILGPDEQNSSDPGTGFGLGRGILLVPHGDQLTAFVNR